MRNLREREVVAFSRSQLISNSTEDRGMEEMLASQPEVVARILALGTNAKQKYCNRVMAMSATNWHLPRAFGGLHRWC